MAQFLQIEIDSAVPVYQQIMDQMRRLVSDGELSPGTPLPSVRQLASELGVNPNTVAKAYQLLELEGTIVTRKRKGAFVGEASSARASLARERRIAEMLARFQAEARALGVEPGQLAALLQDRDSGGPEADAEEPAALQGDKGLEQGDVEDNERG